ncbi:MAG: DUF4252 domain-containing protein [Bacteroidales bacterium]|nr:DUF4252 domain-containing protein [Bacteroidales bacterium]MBQ2912732.1 DUF4252 domain-containing protein [Bacteroidales bacterium]
MKRLFLLAAMLLVTISSFAQDGKSIYQKYSDSEDISAVYVSPAMFKLIGKLPDIEMNSGEVNFYPIIKSLTGLYIINSSNKNINAQLYADVEKFIKSGRYELLMEAKDSGETVKMYTVGNDTVVNSFVMVARDGDETTFICIDGNMNRTDMEKLLAESIN